MASITILISFDAKISVGFCKSSVSRSMQGTFDVLHRNKNCGKNHMSTNSNQKCCLLFWAEQIGIRLGRLGSYDTLLPCRLDAIFSLESRNLYRQNLCPSGFSQFKKYTFYCKKPNHFKNILSNFKNFSVENQN